MAFGLKFLTTKRLTWLLIAIALLAVAGIAHQLNRIKQIERFNQSVTTGTPPETNRLSYEAKYAQAYWLAQKTYYKEATKLFSELTHTGPATHRAAAYHNIGNMFFHKALRVQGNDPRTRDEAEYLLIEAKTAYKNAIKLDNSNWGTRRNLDRVMMLLPENPTPGVSDSDTPGIIMGNIPVGLP